MRPYGELSKGREPLLPHQFCSDCIIATRGYDFREGQVNRPLFLHCGNSIGQKLLLKKSEMPCCDFFETNEAKLSSPINMAPRPLSKPPVSFSHIYPRIASAA